MNGKEDTEAEKGAAAALKVDKDADTGGTDAAIAIIGGIESDADGVTVHVEDEVVSELVDLKIDKRVNSGASEDSVEEVSESEVGMTNREDEREGEAEGRDTTRPFKQLFARVTKPPIDPF